MEDLNFWIIELCVCAAAVAIAENLMPEGNVKKAVYFVLGLIVVMCFVSPIENFEPPDFEIKSESELTSEQTDWLNRTTEDIFKNNIRSLIEKCISSMNIKTKKIDIHTDINEDGSIFIDKVRITISPEYADRIDEVTSEIYRSLGLDADVNVR